VVEKNEEIEYELRKSVKEAEFLRRKKEQQVQKLKDDLIRKKREDARKIRDAIARSEQQEKELERQLAKEKSKLNKVKFRSFFFLFDRIFSFSYKHNVKEIMHV
jgi:vacuolar-type H+-ATPase subunit H